MRAPALQLLSVSSSQCPSISAPPYLSKSATQQVSASASQQVSNSASRHSTTTMDQSETSERAVYVTPHDGSIILRQNAYADMRPFIEQLWEDRRAMCCNIYLDEFPRGTAGKGATKEEEDAFLLGYFSEREFHLQGGRFLKQVLYAIAKFNEDSVLSHAEKWWREYNFCASSGMDAAQIRQVLDLHQAANFPDSFLKRVVLLISDGFRRFYGPQDPHSIDAAESAVEIVPTTAEQHFQEQQHRHRAVSIHDDHVRHGNGRPRQFHKKEYRGRNRRASVSPMITPLQHMSPSFPEFDATAQSYTPVVGFPMQPDGPFVGYYSPPTYAPEPRMPPDLLGSAYYPDTIVHQRNGSFSQRPRPRLVDPHSFARFGEERFAQQRSYAPPYNQRGNGHRSSFNSNRPRRSSLRSGDAWQGRQFERRVYSDHRAYAHPTERNYRTREHRSYLVQNQENATTIEIENDHNALPSLFEDNSVDKEFDKQDSSPKTTEDDSFQTAVETPTATPTEKLVCKNAQSVPNSPHSTIESDEDAPDAISPDDSSPDGVSSGGISHDDVAADGISPVGNPLSVAPSEKETLCQNAESASPHVTTTTESGDTTSIVPSGQHLTTGIHTSQSTASKPGPKQTESFSPFARRANMKKDSKQKLGKSKSKAKPEPVKPKQSIVDTPVNTGELCQESIETHETDVGVDNSISASASSLTEIRTEHAENDNMNVENPERSEPRSLQKQDDDQSKHHTDSATPQMLSTLSSVTALLSGALSSMSSNKSKKGDDSSTASVQNEVPAAAPKKKKSKKTKKKKKVKTTTQAPDGDSTETLANETPVGSPPSSKTFTLRENTNILDTRLSSLNIREGSIVELHENKIGYRTHLPDQQQENLSSKHNELVEQSRRKIQEMQEQEKLLKQRK
ncbi:hypothetical protein KCU85_g764, partial [Aureobasidium melanogenum]